MSRWFHPTKTFHSLIMFKREHSLSVLLVLITNATDVIEVLRHINDTLVLSRELDTAILGRFEFVWKRFVLTKKYFQ
jgi:hypothetical protein